MTTLSHPFMRNPDQIDVPSEHVKIVDEIYAWIQTQPRLPPYSRNHAVLFLHACYWDPVATKSALEKYGAVRAAAPELFDKRDASMPSIQQVFNLCEMISMPKKTPEGYQMLLYRLTDTDPSKVMFADCIKGFCMFNDLRLSEDLLAEGYIVVFDMKGVRLSHIARVQFGPLRSFMAYIQEAHPARLKKIYICHAASFVNQVMALVKPLIKSELMSLLHFTTKGPQTLFAKELLPIEYEGECGSMTDHYKEQRKNLEENYREWLIDSNALKEKPKEKNNNSTKGSSKTSSIAPTIRSFSALEID